MYLRYSPDIEQPLADEQKTIDGIIKGMTQVSEKVEDRQGHAVRASHAKSTGLVIGEMSIADDLPADFRQGLFAKPGLHSVAIRFAQGPGELLGDRVSTHRGMAIKVFAVQGDKLPGHSGETQDFVFATGATFPSGTAEGFLRDAKQIGAATPLPEGFKSAVSSTARNFNRVLHAFGTESPKAGFFGYPFSHPLSDSYFSQAPVRFGDFVAKLAAVPASEGQGALQDWKLNPHDDEDGFRRAIVDFTWKNETVYELRAQLWTNANSQPIEDASVDWSTDESPYRTVATIRIPAQASYSPGRQAYFDEVMTFSPAHSLVLHRPLGSVMRARLQVYHALSKFRHNETGVTAKNPAGVSEIPA